MTGRDAGASIRAMARRSLASLLSIAAFAFAGCGGSAVPVTRTAQGGVLGLDGEHSEAMADARRQMSEHCGGAYTIVGEHYAVTGAYRGRIFSEDQVEYVCGAQPDRPAAPARSPGP